MSSIFDGIGDDGVENLDENLRKWFKEKWVRFGPDGKIRGACARGDDSEGKPKCLPQKKAHALGKKGRKYAASKKRREDPNPERRGKAKNVATKKKTSEGVEEALVHRSYVGSSEPLWNIRDNSRRLRYRKDEVIIANAQPRIEINNPKQSKTRDKEYRKQNDFVGYHYAYIDGKLVPKLPADAGEGRMLKWAGGKFVYADTREPFEKADFVHFTPDRGVVAYDISGSAPAGGPSVTIATEQQTIEGQDIMEDKCPHCGGELISEEMMNEKKDACYHKVKARYKVWPSAYASGALVQCRKKGASNWGTGGKKKNESSVIKGIVDEGTNFVTENILTEGKVLLEGRVVRKLWESAGQKIVEAQLTPQQIQQIFQAAEKGQTQAGGNRTIAGKGVDAASAVNRAWEDLKTKIQNSGPIQNMDAMYDKAAEALKNATGGDQGAMQYVQKYRDFAKKHPVAQSFLYAALIAAAGLSGAGAGGAAALGLLKMTDKLLQGQKFSSAAYSGAKTGGLAYAAGQIGQQLKGTDAAQPVQVDQTDGFDGDAIYRDLSGADVVDKKPSLPAGDPSFKDFSNMVDPDPTSSLPAGDPSFKDFSSMVEPEQGAKAAKQVAKSAVEKIAGEVVNPDQPLSPMQMATINAGKQMGKQYSQDVLDAYNLAVQQGVKPFVGSVVQHADGTTSAGKNAFNFESKQLSKYQVFSIMEAAIMYQTALNEGLMDKFKGAVSKVGQYAATKGHNITTKITADKLLQAWKKAGSPTDSEKVKAVLKSAGVTDQVITTIMPVQASIAGVQPKATTGAVTSTVKATTQPTVAAKPQAPAAAAAQPTSAISQGIAKSPQANVNPELYKRLAARKAGKPIYTYEAAGDTLLDPEVALPQARKITKLIKYDDTVGEIITQIEMLAERTEGIDSRTIQYAIDGVLSAKNALESAVYDLEEAFEDAARDAEFKRDEELGEDTDMRYAAEKTPAINPYGGQKDRQFRGAISETPTDNPTGASGEGGWRTYKPKVAGTFKEDTAYATGGGQGGNAGQSYRKFKPKSAGTFKEDELDEACWKGYHKEGMKTMFGKKYPNCVKNTNEEEQLDEKCWDSHKQVGMKKKGGKMVPNCVPKESAIMKGITGRK